MATKQFNSRIQWKKDTSANWTANNPVLLNGEIAIVVTNTGETRFKVGDGTSSYTALPFQDEAVRALITAADDKIDTHIVDMDNPHEVTKAQIGLGNVDNVKQYSSSNPPPYPVTSVNGDVGAVVLEASDVGAVPTSRTVNGKALSSNITLTYDDVGARPENWVPTLSNLGITATASELNKLDGATVTTQEINYLDGVSSSIQTQLNGKVPTTRTVNGKALSSNITLSAADVDAVPTSRTVNGKPLSSNVTLSASDVGALSTAGGTLTGNLTGRYITGTWLQATANTHSASKQNSVCVFDGSGWIYSRTLAEFANDLGIPDGAEKYSGTLPTSGWKTSGSQRYYQVSISGMTADKTILAIPQWSNQTNQQGHWNKLVNIQSYAGYVRFYASAAPSVSINYTLIYY